jgi:hypothetical protein
MMIPNIPFPESANHLTTTMTTTTMSPPPKRHSPFVTAPETIGKAPSHFQKNHGGGHDSLKSKHGNKLEKLNLL